ncbi:MAG: hypothetical protein ACLVEX_01500 [Ruthenibacterium lactatiformans]
MRLFHRAPACDWTWRGTRAPSRCGRRRFHSLLCLSGSGAVICGGGAVPFAKGDSLFLPAGLGAYTIAGRAQLVLTTL